MTHEDYLLHALGLAKERRGYCAPNPSVGAIIVQNGQIIATGRHEACGMDHAEVDALKQAPDNLSDAIMYVTLEPCSHFGRTPPCTDAIRRSGINEVYYGYQDPNPLVDSETLGQYVSVPQITEFYRSYAHFVHTKTPFVTAKLAMSLDSVIAGVNGEPLIITSQAAKQQTFHHRRHADAILTTSRAIIADDPELSVRLDDNIEHKPIYILDSQLKTPMTAKLFSRPERITIFHSDNVKPTSSVRCVPINNNDLSAVLSTIGEDGVHDLWIEAGPTCFNNFLNQGLAHRALIYIAPKVIGKGMQAFDGSEQWPVRSKTISWYHYGEDAVCDILFDEE